MNWLIGMKLVNTIELFLPYRGRNVDGRGAQHQLELFGILRWNVGKPHSGNN